MSQSAVARPRRSGQQPPFRRPAGSTAAVVVGLALFILSASAFSAAVQQTSSAPDPTAARVDPYVERSRVLVTTDIANEPGERFYRNAPGADLTTFSDAWIDEHIRSKGPLGQLSPLPCCIHEGDRRVILTIAAAQESR